MPKGQAPYVPQSRKDKAFIRSLVDKGLVSPAPDMKAAGDMIKQLSKKDGFYDYRVIKERDTQTQRFKSRKVD